MNTTSSDTDLSSIRDHQNLLPDRCAEQIEQIERVRLQVDRLPVQQQEILRLRLHDNLSYKQIANVTGLSVTNVGYHLHTAIASLRTRVT